MNKDVKTIIIQNLKILSIALILVMGFIVQDTWAQTNEADLVVLVGDIDNLGYGFPEGFDVFSGKPTPVHSYPFKPEADDPPGTDRIMVGTGSKNSQDGYSSTTSRPDNLPQSINIQYDLGTIQVKSAAIQIFADDFQSSTWKSKFQVTVNGQRAPFLEDVLNSLSQTGPVGKLVTVQVPAEFLSQVTSERLTIYIDDPATGAGDGYSVDFVRLLVNPRFSQVGKVSGKVTDAKTGLPLSGVKVSAAGTITGQTGNDGVYVLNDVPAGLAVVTASKSGYTPRTLSTDLEEGKSATLDFSLSSAPPGEQTSTQTTSLPPFGSPEPAPVDRMTLQAGQRRVVSGDLVYVPVWLINGLDVANIDFTISYNANVAIPEGKLIKGNLLDNALFESNTGEKGLIRSAFAQNKGVSGTGTVTYIPFRAVGQPGTQTTLDAEVTSINNPAGTLLTIDVIDGSIQIVGPGEGSQGDCDGDGTLTAADAHCALQMSVKLIPERLTLDMNTDRQVTSRDSVIILQRRLSEIIV